MARVGRNLVRISVFERTDDGYAATKQFRIHRICAWTKKEEGGRRQYPENVDHNNSLATQKQIGYGCEAGNYRKHGSQEPEKDSERDQAD